MKSWTTEKAIDLCKHIEKICTAYGCHVALTGGTLYKEGKRKDLDILFYRIRQVKEIDINGLFIALSEIGVYRVSGFGWCYKATLMDEYNIDCFFPEEQGGDYVPSDVSPDITLDLSLLQNR
jgi:hypothetical protein